MSCFEPSVCVAAVIRRILRLFYAWSVFAAVDGLRRYKVSPNPLLGMGLEIFLIKRFYNKLQ